MNSANKFKKICLLIFALMTMVLSVNAAPTAYAVLSNGTLTFKYGEMPTNETYCYDVSNTAGKQPWVFNQDLITKVVFDSSFASARPESCAFWFSKLVNLTEITNIKYLNTSKVTDMKSMFNECKLLTRLDLRTFDTSKVTDMCYMFYHCSSLTSLDLQGFDASNVTNMSGMFQHCSSLESLDCSGIRTSNKLTNMAYMFYNCQSLTWLDLRRFDTSNVTNMGSMFWNCTSLTSLDLRGIETSNVTNMSSMFELCNRLTSLDLRSFNTSKVTDMRNMFQAAENLGTIYCNDAWTCDNAANMFAWCKVITKKKTNDRPLDATYANPTTGYFTSKLETYNLSIKGTSVTDVNQWNLASIDGVEEGTAYFYDATKTLTLMNTQIAVSESNVNVIESRLDTLYIEVYGLCSLSSKLSAGIAGLSHIVIKGDGLLVVSGYGAIYWLNQSKSLTVEGGVKVMVQGTNLCAIGPCQSIKVKGSETYLVLRGAEGSCEKVNELQLSDGLAILSPSGAKYNGSTIVDKDGNAIINDWVAIGYQYYEPGDVNHDDAITMADANAVVNYFLATDKPEDFDVTTADVNEDGTITMADANKIVNMFLGQ